MKTELKGTIFIILAAIFSGISVAINKLFVSTIDPVIFSATRGLIIGIIFFAIIIFTSNLKKEFEKISWFKILFIGIVGGGLAFLFFFSGLSMTTAIRASFLNKTLPIFTFAIGAIFLREKLQSKHFLALFFMLSGLILIELLNVPKDVRVGDLLVIFATILMAIEYSVSKSVMKTKSNWVVSFSRMFIGSIFLFLFALFVGKFDILLQLSFKQWSYILISTSTLFFYILFWYLGLKNINLSKASALLLLAPPITLILSVIFLHEKIQSYQLIGCFLILFGSYIISRIESETRQP